MACFRDTKTPFIAFYRPPTLNMNGYLKNLFPDILPVVDEIEWKNWSPCRKDIEGHFTTVLIKKVHGNEIEDPVMDAKNKINILKKFAQQ